ncbi:hypothetical protein Mgra_00007683 [Meloidogyne graminicola]|uniref:Uncharacterized protein n=1 Tax=Meloidogyne graminicola TaxID=189291 RepID=A0A8S9ZI02_9BILA|nr:hypothetical protein Mgra_00007683 [Meloidogyne graminicola]
MSKHCVFKLLRMNEENNEEKDLIIEETSPRQRFYEHQYIKPSTSKQLQQNNSNDHSRSPEEISLHSISSSSTDLSSPPRAFPKISKIVPEKKSYQIKIKRSRWEPISSGEERRRFESLKSKKVKKKKKTKGKRRKEMVFESHRNEDHFRPLKKFVNNRRKLATELLDSVDLETLYEIFPELEEKSDVEAHKIVYDILCGMSLKRILADLNGDDLPGSSSSSEEEEEYQSSDQEDVEQLNEYSSSNEGEENKQKREEKGKEEIEIKIIKTKKKRIYDDLEEGEICSKMSISDEELKDEKEEGIENISENEDDVKIKENEEKMKKIESNKINLEPKFIVSVDISDELNLEEELEENDNLFQNQIEHNFKQKIVCILPPSPSTTITSSIFINKINEIGEENNNKKQEEDENCFLFVSSSPSIKNKVIIQEKEDPLQDIDYIEDINFELVDN